MTVGSERNKSGTTSKPQSQSSHPWRGTNGPSLCPTAPILKNKRPEYVYPPSEAFFITNKKWPAYPEDGNRKPGRRPEYGALGKTSTAFPMPRLGELLPNP